MSDTLSHVQFVSEVKFGDDGLVPVIAQSVATGEVLMFAWMNREALARTVESGQVYIGRARARSCGTRVKSRAIFKQCTKSDSTVTKTWCCSR